MSGRRYCSDDPVGDWDRHIAQAEAEMEELPKCEECGQPVYEGYELPDGTVYCDYCMATFAKSW